MTDTSRISLTPHEQMAVIRALDGETPRGPRSRDECQRAVVDYLRGFFSWENLRHTLFFLAPVITLGSIGSLGSGILARRLFSRRIFSSRPAPPTFFLTQFAMVLGDELLSGAFTGFFRSRGWGDQGGTGEGYLQAYSKDFQSGLIVQSGTRMTMGLVSFAIPRARILAAALLPFWVGGLNAVAEQVVEGRRPLDGEGVGWDLLYRSVVAATAIHGQTRFLKAIHLHADDWGPIKREMASLFRTVFGVVLSEAPRLMAYAAQCGTGSLSA